ncbi:RNA polymerase II-associated protein [Auriscalpium vulgare]|uniref:RNA polymerase II-associated protein n=1 Tax=Auriscalpium vulgare TaxID=40419 RepID=A0ACB8RIX8_9AGAM|nr:RNA polymerase II-associated protein [Auriscalpium vulgare]
MSFYPWNSAPGRSIDIELSGQEVINIELDALDSNVEDVVEVLMDGQPKVEYWTRLAGEYLRRGDLDAAEAIMNAAAKCFKLSGSTESFPAVYSLLANIHLARARSAPKIKLANPRQDILLDYKTRDDYVREATQDLNICDHVITEQLSGADSEQRLEAMMELIVMTRAIHQLANNEMDDALRSFQSILVKKPTNLIALLGKARILYARRQYGAALKIFQQVLQLNPHCLPDPRIGIGLCFWAMNHREQAKAAWQRSAEVNPSESAGQLLLGIEALNASKNPNMSDEERVREITIGSKLIEKAFNGNQRNASAANALCDIFLRKGLHSRALKLAERTVQFADTRAVLADGYIRAGRVCHVDGNYSDALRYYQKAAEGPAKNVLAVIGVAQIQLRNNEIPAAIHTLDTLLQPPNAPRSVEAMAMLASLRAHPRPGVSSSEAVQETVRARELFDRVHKTIEHGEELTPLNGHSQKPHLPARAILDDVEMHLEVARLWRNENLDRTGKALREALRVSQENGDVDPRLWNNLGVLAHLEGQHDQARAMYENALTGVTVSATPTAEAMSTSILYNLARVYEDVGEDTMASEAYGKLLSRHPEYVDAKIRQADMLGNLNQRNDAHELLKDALVSQSHNLNVRAFYTYFLIQSNLPKPAREFVFATLKDHDKHDVWSLCAAGWLHYHQARESRDSSSKGVDERKKLFLRSAEFYEKALHLDPMCAVAAQGLAIVTAEDALGTLGGTLPPGPTPDEGQKRATNARDALEVFAKVRESTNDGSVYINIGHCHFARDEFDRAIESYETASRRYYHDQNVSVLLSLARSWYAKANKDQSFSSMITALGYTQKALHIQPNDKAVLYNIAMIQQKAAEMMFALPSAKRTLKDLQRAIEHASHAQKMFASLAADPSTSLPYNRDIADQRKKYGDSMLRRAEEHLVAQRQHEGEQHARLEAARQKRLEEKQRQEALERERTAKLQEEAEKLRGERDKARAEALQWTQEVRMESDDERERKARKAANKRTKSGPVSGDEDGAANGEPKKKRTRKLKKGTATPAEGSDGEEEALFSGGENVEKPAKKRPKKRIVRDDDEDEPSASAPRKKQYKSKEIISDSDESME